MEIKLFEVRDSATFIPVIGITISGADGYLARRAGFGSRCIYLIHMTSNHCTYDPYDWGNRTMRVAHEHIEAEWDTLQSGDVIDVQYILGETTSPKESEEVTEALSKSKGNTTGT